MRPNPTARSANVSAHNPEREFERGYGEGACEICGEPADNEMGEIYSPEWPDDKPSVIAHAQCGIDAGLEVA